MQYHKMDTVEILTGHQYDVMVAGQPENFYPFGFANGSSVPVFLKPGERKRRDSPVQPGDRVSARIEEFQPGCAVGRVKYNHGCFIRTGYKTTVRLTGRNPRDIRDVLSGPNQGGGISGVFTIVKRALFPQPGTNPHKAFPVRVEWVGKDKNHKYLIVANPLDREFIRDTNNEVFYAAWPPQGVSASGVGELSKSNLPVSDKIRKYTFGVPKEFDVLFLTPDNKVMIGQGNSRNDVSSLHASDAVDKFADTYRGNRFRLVLVPGDQIGNLKRRLMI